MTFLMNTWYVAAWADEITGDALVNRTILNEPVLLYRDEAGSAHAIGNRCPHRFAPLHLGARHNNDIECGYHGLRFDSSGMCVLNPHGSGRIASNMRVPSWPLVERYGVLWIWMGNAGAADPAAIVDVSQLVDPTLGVVRGSMRVRASYLVVTDNLMDLSHAQFLHKNFLSAPGMLSAPHEDHQEDDTISRRRKGIGLRASARFARFMDDPEVPVDVWSGSRWDAPGIICLDNGVTPTGEPEERGLRHFGTHLITPETDTTSHYFYASVRNYRVGDPDADAFARTWQRTGFGEQDGPMIEAVQQMMGDADFASLRPVLLESDGAALRVRSVMRRLIEREQHPERPLAVSGSGQDRASYHSS